MVKHTKRKSHRRNQRHHHRGGYGFFLGTDNERIGGQATVMRYSQCPMTDTLSKNYPTALYNSNGGSRNRRRSQRRRSHRRSRH
jgi:hypothetical protein